MKSQNKVRSLFLILAVALVVAVSSPVSAQPPTPNGTTSLTFSSNPATLSGDGAVDVTITTTTTSEDQPDEVDNGKVIIELATDGSVLDVELNPIGGNPVPAAEVIYWMALSDPGVSPVSGITTLDVDLDALGFVCGTIGGFRAHYVTGGGKNKVDTHFSDEVDLTAVCPCEWVGETAWADGTRYVTQGNWATYTPYIANSTVILYAGQDMEAGTVHFSAPDADTGEVTITITLVDGEWNWRFEEVEENVKIQDYASAPSGNPSPGLFNHKDTATESPFSITVPANNFYGVHVNVEWEDYGEDEVI